MRPLLRLGLVVALALLARPATAQVSGTYIVTGATNWSAATSWSGGAAPDAGGTATFDDRTGQVGGFTVTVDTTSRTLGGLTFNSAFSTTIAASGGASIAIPASGLTLNSVNSIIGSPSTATFNSINLISAPITGAGDLTKTGFGSVSLSGANTFTGTVRVNQGNLNLIAGDTSLGALANGVVFDGGTVTTSTAAWTTSRPITVNAGGAYLRGFTATTFNGPLSGSGSLVGQINTGALTLTADSSATFSGQVRAESRQIILSGAGRVGAGGTAESGSILNLDSSGTAVSNRLSGRAVTVRGAQLTMTGNAAAGVTESVGGLTLTQGFAAFTLTPNATTPQPTVFQASGLTRQNNALLFVRGTALGTQPVTGGVANMVFTSSPGTLVGGGGDPLTTATASVLPFAHGNTSAGLLNGSVHLTWDAVTGRLVPLDPTLGYAQDTLLTSAATDNVNLTASVSLTGPASANALRLTPAAALTLGGVGPLTVTSGAVLNTSTAAAAPLVTISAPLTAGSRELVLVSTNGSVFTPTGLVVSGVVSGTGGLTRGGTGAVTLSGANTYTGPTTFAAGTTLLGGPALTVTADGSAPSVLGQDTSPVSISGGAASPSVVYTSGNLVLGRNVVATLGASGNRLGTAGLSAAESVTLNGNLVLNDPNPFSQPVSPGAPGQVFTFSGLFELTGGQTRPTAVTVNGVVSGTGGLRSNFAAYTILNATNTYTGPTVIGTSVGQAGSGVTAQPVAEIWEVGADNAFGTGTLYVQTSTPAASATVQALPAIGTVVTAGAARSLANPVVMVNGYAAFGGSFPLTLTGPLELGGGSTNNSVLTVGANSPLTITGVVSRGGLIKNGPGSLTLANASNQNGGQVTVRQGVLSVASIGNAGVFASLGGAPGAATYLTLSGNAPGDTGSLQYTGPGESTNRLFSLTGSGGTLDASGTGPLVFTNTAAVSQNQMPGSTAGGLTGFTVQIGQAVFPVSTTNAIGLVVGSTVTGVTTPGLFPAGTTVTEVGVNFFRTSAVTTNAGVLTAQAIRIDPTTPAALLPVRTLTLTGTNTGQNVLTPALVNSANYGLAVVKTGAGTWALAGTNAYTGGTTVSAGTLSIGAGGTTGSVAGNVLNNATLRFNRSNALSYAGVISGTGVVNQVGAGTTTLTGINTYSGGTGVSAGTLLVNGQMGGDSGTGTGAVTVAGGTFGGNGRAAGPVTVNAGGTLYPGIPGGTIGTLTAAGGATFTASTGAAFRVAVANGAVSQPYDTGLSATAGTGNSLLAAGASAVTFGQGGTMVVDVTGAVFAQFSPYSFTVATGTGISPSGAGVTPVQGYTYQFFDNGVDVTGNFYNVSLNIQPGAGSAVLNFSPVPEPTTVLAVAGLGLGLLRLRRRVVA